MSENNNLIKIVESNAKSIAALSDTVAEQGRQLAEQGRQLAEQGRHLERTIKTVDRLAELQIQFVETSSQQNGVKRSKT